MSPKPLNSVGGFSVGETPTVVIAPNTHIFGSNANITGDLVVTANATIGNVRSDNYQYANGEPIDFQLQPPAGANTQIQFNLNSNFGASANLTFDSDTNNLTVIGTVSVFGVAGSSDFPNATIIASQANTGASDTVLAGLVGEAAADEVESSIPSVGIYGIGKTDGNIKAAGVQGKAIVNNSGDPAPAVGVRGHSTSTHSEGYNIGVLGNASGSGVENYAFYIQDGGIGSIEKSVFWDLVDDSNVALTFNSTNKADIFSIDTTEDNEGISTSGMLEVSGNAELGGILTDNYFYSNGEPVNFVEAAGSNNQIQFNSDGDLSASANFIFDPDTDELTLTGTLSVSGNATAGNVSATDVTGTTLGGTLTTAAQPNVTSVGTLTSLDVTGNVSAGNVSATDVTGTTLGGTLTTAAQPNVTSVGTLASLSVSGNASVDNLLAAENITGNTLTGILTTPAQPNVTSVGELLSLEVSGNVSAGNVSATDVTGTTLGGTLTTAAQPNVTSLGTLTSLDVTGNVSAGNVSATDVSSTTLGGTLTTAAQPNVTSVGTLTSLDVTGNISAGNLSGTLLTGTLATAAQPNVTSVGTLTSLDVTGNVSAGNISATDVTGTTLGGTLTTNAQPNVTSVGTLTSLDVTGNVSAGNVNATDVTGTTLGGSLTTNAQPNITSVGSLTSLTVTGNANAGNIGANNAVFTGTGSFGGNVNMGNAHIINLANPTASSDAATKEYVDEVAQGLQARTAARVKSDTNLDATYDNGPENDGVGSTLTADSNVEFPAIDGVSSEDLNVVAMRILVAGQDNAEENGLYVLDQIGIEDTQPWILRRCVECDTDEKVPGSFVFIKEGTVYGSTGWVAVVTLPFTIGTDPINWTQFSGAGTFTAGSGLTLDGTEFSVNAAQPGITSVGTLTGLDVDGNIIAANISANTGIFAGNGSGLTSLTGANVTGQVGNALVAGTVYTNAQPNITSVGTLTSLAVTGNVSAGNVSATDVTGTTLGGTLTTAAQPNVTSVGTLTSLDVTGNVSAGNVSGTVLTGTLATAAQPNITSVGTLTSLAVTGNVSAGNVSISGTLSVTGNANVGNIGAAAGVFSTVSGNGRGLFSLSASNIDTGTLDQARLANSSLTVNGQTISLGGSGTVTANTTQSLTPGDFLTGSSFNGGTARTFAVDATNANTANKVVARDASGNFSAGTITATLSGAATTAGTVTTAAQPNITSVGTLTSLAISGTNALTVRTITTGANTTTGTITGNWSLSAGSRLNATYADLAECYVADQPYEPGTVLLFGGEQEVTAEGNADSHAVAGVVSTEPAYLMNSMCEGNHVVELALIGRVPCKVQGPISKGDLIVSSDNAGYGKANNQARAGTIVGKALTALSEAEGVVEILVGRT